MRYEDYETVLEARRDELMARLHQIADELDDPVSADTSERAKETEDNEVLEGLGQQGLAELRAIEAALDRIRKGTFGICAKCGEPISEARLEAVPHAALCETCIREG